MPVERSFIPINKEAIQANIACNRFFFPGYLMDNQTLEIVTFILSDSQGKFDSIEFIFDILMWDKEQATDFITMASCQCEELGFIPLLDDNNILHVNLNKDGKE